MRRWAILLYGLMSYLFFLGVFLYAIGFLGNLFVPAPLDGPVQLPIGQAIAINFLLLSGFAVQHSLMARPFFKRWLTRYLPQSIERSTYVLASNLAMVALFVFWQPMGPVIWSVDHTLLVAVLYALFFAGWAIIFVSTCLISHFDLFGLRQVWFEFRGQPYEPLKFETPGFYRMVRHPLYVGWLMTFWCTPTMTAGHLLFAVATTVYILIAIQLEESDLVDVHGVAYVSYRNNVPMLLPRLFRRTTGISTTKTA